MRGWVTKVGPDLEVHLAGVGLTRTWKHVKKWDPDLPWKDGPDFKKRMPSKEMYVFDNWYVIQLKRMESDVAACCRYEDGNFQWTLLENYKFDGEGEGTVIYQPHPARTLFAPMPVLEALREQKARAVAAQDYDKAEELKNAESRVQAGMTALHLADDEFTLEDVKAAQIEIADEIRDLEKKEQFSDIKSRLTELQKLKWHLARLGESPEAKASIEPKPVKVEVPAK